MKFESLHELYITELRDLYSAENQILKALPRMVEKAALPDLKMALEDHLFQTREHVRRLEEVFEMHGEDVKSETCQGMEGIIDEGEDMMKKDASPSVRDAAIIAAAQKVEHYEMASYGTVRTFAEQMGHNRAAALLQKTLDEEGETDKRLSGIATRRVNPEATRVA